MAIGPVLGIGLGTAALIGLGGFLWRRSRKTSHDRPEEMVERTIECADGDADAVLTEVHHILESAAARIPASSTATRRRIAGLRRLLKKGVLGL